jgi:hypothetical protein
MYGRDDSGHVSPISQPSQARLPIFHEELKDEEASGVESTGDEGRLGVPVVEGGQRISISSIGSDMGFEQGPEVPEERGNARGVLHSTRASSGVFPEP